LLTILPQKNYLEGCVLNIATLAQRFEAPEKSNLKNLVGKVNQLVRCLWLPNNQLENQTIADHALDAAKETRALVSHLHGRIAELEKLSVTDELTGLFNRRGFNIHPQRVLSNASRYEEQSVLVYIDLDGFKP
jgi:predicted signal transduction protein with EAL and GGDEF domain